MCHSAACSRNRITPSAKGWSRKNVCSRKNGANNAPSVGPENLVHQLCLEVVKEKVRKMVLVSHEQQKEGIFEQHLCCLLVPD